LAVLAIILPLIWPLYCLGKIDTTSLICECSCILWPNVENFCPNNGQFFSVGDVATSPASPCRALMNTPENVGENQDISFEASFNTQPGWPY